MLIFYSTRKSNPTYKKNILKSCKTDVRIEEFVNENQYSLTESYNKALDMCDDDEILVLMHDDIELPKNWDVKINELFETSDYGIIGVAGSTSLSKSAIWWENQADLAGIVSHEKTINNVIKKYDTHFSYEHDFIMRTCCLDGVFFALKKDRVKTRFNENIKGFHFYDVSFTFENHLKGVKVGVTTQIKVHHKSIGQVTKSWHDNRLVFLKEYDKYLPVFCNPVLEDIAKDAIVDIKETSIGVIILTKNKIDILKKCLSSLIEKTDSRINLNIVIGDTGSSEESIFELKEYIKSVDKENIKLSLDYQFFYNFAKNNNYICKNYFKDEELLLFCNNDIELVNNALDLMVQTYQKRKQKCGTVGCRLLYPNLKIQHGGIIMYVDETKKTYFTHLGLKTYYAAGSNLTSKLIGSTGAFLLINRENFLKLNGFNEETTECFEDVILNIESRSVLGKINYYEGNAVCLHHESLTRNEDPNQIERMSNDYNKVLMPKIIKYKNSLKNFILIR